MYYFLNDLVNRTMIVNISNLPNNIQKETNHFAEDGKCPHVSVGPTEPKEGPIFPKEDADADKDVIISNP